MPLSQIIFVSLFVLLFIFTILPLAPSKHWFFRAGEFAKVHIAVLQLILVLIHIIFFFPTHSVSWIVLISTLCCLVYHASQLIIFTPLVKNRNNTFEQKHEKHEVLRFISYNVYQENKQYQNFINLIHEKQPHFFLTLESNSDWEKGLLPLEQHYPHSVKFPLENTYGMFFYSKFPFNTQNVHFFVSDDLPSIEVEIEISAGKSFTFIGVHPPPPSPTEEETSKERDGELMAIAKYINQQEIKPLFVAGDFNNVAWARTSMMFRKITGLIDPRRGRGLFPTFPTKMGIFGIPLDLMFHSDNIFVKNFQPLPNIGSDHFPVLCDFIIEENSTTSKTPSISSKEKEQMEEDIQEGKSEEGDR